MMDIILVISFLLIAVISVKLRESIINLNKEKIEKDKYSLEIIELNKANIEQKILISELKTKLSLLENEYSKNNEKSFHQTKAALFELGTKLSEQLIDLHKKENNESRKLSEEQIFKASEKFNNEFEKIVKSITKLDSKIQESKDTVDLVKNSLLNPASAGALAEITLENILKNSGLRSGTDYFIQYHIVGSGKLRPDAVIFLPAGNIMIIDAKSSKFLFELTTDEASLKKAMNTHIKSLSSKEYKENIMQYFDSQGIKYNHIITLMFLPTEQSVEKITNISAELISKSWESGIFPVGPVGLINMLSLAKFQISDNLRSENYKIILEEVKKLLQTIAHLSEHGKKMGQNLQNLVNHYDKFAASFNRNFLSKARSINRLGIDMPKFKELESNLERYNMIPSNETIELELAEAEKD